MSKTDVGVLTSGMAVVVVDNGEIITVKLFIPVGLVVAIDIFVLVKALVFDRDILILGIIWGEMGGTLMRDWELTTLLESKSWTESWDWTNWT